MSRDKSRDKSLVFRYHNAACYWVTDQFEFFAESSGEVDRFAVDVLDGDDCAAVGTDLCEQL